ncbi:MAG TPA: hypothetical protein VND24_02755, partial [Steroidobacteraceae bacterium]|nr:hypothetical protein [Steroidobacteraceae bacterium]
IVLYASGQASFVIDAYTRRTFRRLGIAPVSDRYDDWRILFMDSLPADAPLFNEYHASIVRHAKVSCRVRPLCAACILLERCPTGTDVAERCKPKHE